jgi:hypothetical protein
MTDGLSNTLINTASALKSAQIHQQFSIGTFKKGLEAQEQAAMQLLESAPTMAPAGDRGHLLDVMA